jgi:hypothetical protein
MVVPEEPCLVHLPMLPRVVGALKEDLQHPLWVILLLAKVFREGLRGGLEFLVGNDRRSHVLCPLMQGRSVIRGNVLLVLDSRLQYGVDVSVRQVVRSRIQGGSGFV